MRRSGRRGRGFESPLPDLISSIFIMSVMVRAHILFTGMVQGVGFRYTATSYARVARLQGRVRNLPDGRVEVDVEGPRTDLLEFIERLKNHFTVNITACDVDWLPLQGNFQGFDID